MNRRVIAIIKGGLGNQLFCYAAARAFALRAGRELLLDDSSGFARDGYGRRYRLDQFPVAARPAPPANRLGPPKSPRHKLVRALDRLLPAPLRSYLAENTGTNGMEVLERGRRRAVVHLNGYWQNERYFTDHADTIRRELEPPSFTDPADLTLERELADSASIFLHIRRHRYSPRLGADYYAAAIRHARETIPGAAFAIFGDDPAWARATLDFGNSPVRWLIDPDSSELRDFRLMAACRHAIVANSSFSWWAAWLRTAPNKRVWFPAEPGWPLQPASGWILVPNSLESDTCP